MINLAGLYMNLLEEQNDGGGEYGLFCFDFLLPGPLNSLFSDSEVLAASFSSSKASS